MIRVLHLTAVDDSIRYILANQLVWLRAAGFDVHAAATPGAHVDFITEGLRIPFHAVPIKRTIGPFADLRTLRVLRALLRREHFDIVHTHMPKATLLGPIAARTVGTPYVVNTLRPVFHENTATGAKVFFGALDKLALSLTDAILAQNPDDIAYYEQLGIAPAAKMTPLGNGIDLARFSPSSIDREETEARRRGWGFSPENVVVGMVGRFVADKGYEEFFEALGEVARRHPSVRYLIVGDSLETDHGKLPEDLPSRYGLEGLGHRVGHREDMPQMYAAMDVLLFPTRRDAFPRVLMEAAAMGKPIVASDIRGCRRSVAEGRNGFLVKVGAVADFALRLEKLVTAPELRESMGRFSRRMAMESFDEARVFRVVEECYRRLAGSNRR